ncbi:MAG: DUF3127 domain-containing protein [Anaerolineales bacterium]
MMNIRGKLYEIYDVNKVSESFRKREFVVEFKENPQYPEYIKFELIQDKCDLLNNFKVGSFVEVYFNLKGRLWTNPKGEKVYFNSLQAWRLEPIEGSGEAQGQYHPPVEDDLSSFTEEDELPF